MQLLCLCYSSSVFWARYKFLFQQRKVKSFYILNLLLLGLGFFVCFSSVRTVNCLWSGKDERQNSVTDDLIVLKLSVSLVQKIQKVKSEQNSRN